MYAPNKGMHHVLVSLLQHFTCSFLDGQWPIWALNALHGGSSGLPCCRSVERNEQGGFFQIFQVNKWRLRKAKEAVAAATPAMAVS